MNQVMISADSTCDLPVDLQRQRHVYCFALSILLGDTAYADGVEIRPADIYADVAENHRLPKTAAVNVSEYVDFFKPFIEAGNDVIHINIGSALSSSHNNCKLAAEELPGVYPVDSRNLSTGTGHLVIEAAERIAKGMAAADIVAELNEIAGRVSASFVIDTLEYLYKGGRCSALAMFGANLLRLKPSIRVDNADGSMGVDKKYRGSLDKALEQYVADQLEGRDDIVTKRIFITHSGISEERIDMVRELVKKYQSFDEILVTRAGCTVSSHCGPNTLGVLFITK